MLVILSFWRVTVFSISFAMHVLLFTLSKSAWPSAAQILILMVLWHLFSSSPPFLTVFPPSLCTVCAVGGRRQTKPAAAGRHSLCSHPPVPRWHLLHPPQCGPPVQDSFCCLQPGMACPPPAVPQGRRGGGGAEGEGWAESGRDWIGFWGGKGGWEEEDKGWGCWGWGGRKQDIANWQKGGGQWLPSASTSPVPACSLSTLRQTGGDGEGSWRKRA